MDKTRRRFVSLLTTLPLVGIFSARPSLPLEATTLELTPDCDDHDDPTPPQIEGPYFKTNSPERINLVESGITGSSLILTGRVLNTNCKPVTRALLDWWHADDKGAYDNEGFRLRGHQYTDNKGNFRLETIVPGLYTGRTRHLHVKVQAPGKPVLTTQLYFPNDSLNSRDGLFRPALLMSVSRQGNTTTADFTFVVKA